MKRRGFRRLFRGLSAAFADEQVRGLLGLAAALIAVASVFYWLVEGWNLLDSVYFAVMTIATVGYGDLYPHTALGKIFTMLYVLCGLGLFVSAATAIADSILTDQRDDT